MLFVGSCVFENKKQQPVAEAVEPEPDIEEVKTLPPLEGDEVYYKNKDPFGEVVNLTGQQLDNDTAIFKVSGSQMLVKGDRIIVKNGINGHAFMQFSLPDMRFLGHSGRLGNGPDEFVFASLVPSPDTSILAYTFEMTNRKLYRYEKSGELIPYPFKFSELTALVASEKQIVNIAPGDFIYVDATPKGKSVFRSVKTGDSITTQEVFNLTLNKRQKSWVAYTGDFVVNSAQNRMAYAYKYYKIIKFMNLEAQTVKTINFEQEEFDDGSVRIINGADRNVTHYWGACAGNDYVYFLYSGRTPVQVMSDNNKGQTYMYVEQYDWNGNPVHKYRLDKWGYFTVDEKNNKIYMLSTNDDDPFFLFSF
jgi:hypothetical protein